MVAGVAQVDAQVVVGLCVFLLNAHAGQACTLTQLRQFGLGQLVDEQQDRRLAHFAFSDIAIWPYGRGGEHGRPAIEQHEAGDLLAGNGRRSGLVDDRLDRGIYVRAYACGAGLAFEQGIGGAAVFHDEHAFIAAGAVQRFTYVLFIIGPLPVGFARQVLQGVLPYGITGQELARRQ